MRYFTFYCVIGHFSGKNRVKFRNFVNFSSNNLKSYVVDHYLVLFSQLFLASTSRNWPRPRSSGEVLASFNITAKLSRNNRFSGETDDVRRHIAVVVVVIRFAVVVITNKDITIINRRIVVVNRATVIIACIVVVVMATLRPNLDPHDTLPTTRRLTL